jgi:YVTN family beta-propeller protein
MEVDNSGEAHTSTPDTGTSDAADDDDTSTAAAEQTDVASESTAPASEPLPGEPSTTTSEAPVGTDAPQLVSEPAAKPPQHGADAARVVAESNKASSPAASGASVTENSALRRFVGTPAVTDRLTAATTDEPAVRTMAVQTSSVPAQDIPAAFSGPPTPQNAVSAAPDESAASPNLFTAVASLIGFGPSPTNSPVPPDSPLNWAVFAFARKPQQEAVNDTPRIAADPAQSSQTFATMAATGVMTTPIAVGDYPSGVAISGDKVYVVNSGDPWAGISGTVSVIDSTTNLVVDTIESVGYWAPTRVAASADGQRVYVADYDHVWVIDTDSNEVVDIVYIPVQDGEYYNGVWDVAVSPDPDSTRVYAARGDGTISVIDANTNEVISTTAVGFWDGDMEVSIDGRLYAADGVGDTVVVLDSNNLNVIGTVDVGPSEFDKAQNVAVSPDGTRVYVTVEVRVVEPASGGYSNGWFIGNSRGRTWRVTDTYSAVSVIDTETNTEIATITVADGASDVAFSSDGLWAYVTHSDGKTVTVIDTRTNTVTSTFTTDQSSGTGARGVAVRTVYPEDGSVYDTVYVTDSDDNAVYASLFNAVTAL